MFPLLKAFILEIALEVFFGIEKDQQSPKINQSITDIVDASSALPINIVLVFRLLRCKSGTLSVSYC